MRRDEEARLARRDRQAYNDSRVKLVPPTEGGCMATVAVPGKRWSMQRIQGYEARRCCHKAKETVGPLHLCTVHARMVWEGLLDETGYTGQPADLANRRNLPKLRYTWMPKIDPKV